MSVVLFALVILWPGLATALDPDRGITQYRQRVWNAGNGLGDDSVTALTQTRDGFMWIGTAGGLVRFDGARFTRPAADDTEAFRGHRVLAMAEDSAGDLWVTTDGGALARLRSGVLIETLDTESGLPDGGNPVGIATMRDGTVWIATTAGLVHRDPGANVNVFTTAEGLPSDVLTALHVDPDGIVWIGTASAGLARYQGGSFKTFTTLDGLPGDAVNTITRDKTGDLWVGLTSGLARLRAGSWKTYTRESGLSGNHVTCLQADRDGNLWIGTASSGVNRIANGRINRFTAADGLSSPRVQSLTEDRDGNIWIGTLGGGLNRLADAPYVRFTTREGLPSDTVGPVLEDRDGNVWIGTHGGGLVRHSGGSLTTYTAANHDLPGDRIQALHEHPTRGLWIGTTDGLARYRKGTFTKVVAGEEDLPLRAITAIVSDLRGDLWIGTRGGGLVRLATTSVDGEGPPELQRFTTEEGLTSETITTLHASTSDDLWIGTRGGGLLRLGKDGVITPHKPAGGAGENQAEVIRTIHEDASGTLWIGTEHDGLIRLTRDGKSAAFTTAEGLLDDSVYQLLDDGSGSFWIAGSRGIYHLTRAELDAVASGSRAAALPVMLDGDPRLWTKPPQHPGSPTAWRARDGQLWFATTGGVMKIDPNPPPRAPAPPVVLEAVTVDRVPVDPRAALTLEPGTRTLMIHYTVPTFVAPEMLKFRYRLEGFDDDWIGAGDRRTAIYTDLPPGDYKFHVAASTGADEWSATETVIAITQAPLWYQRRAVQLVGGLALLLAGLGVFFIRTRPMTARLAKFKQEANTRGKDLRAAESQISKLKAQLNSARERPELETWARALAIDLARPLQASAIDVWMLGDHGLPGEDEARSADFTALTETITGPPPLVAVREAAQSQRVLTHEDISLAPIHAAGWMAAGTDATAHALLGVVVIRGRASVSWGEEEQRVVLCFAQQLGAAFELGRLREQLDITQSRVAMSRRDLIARGTDLLQVCPTCRACHDHSVKRCPNDNTRLEVQGVLPFRVMGRYRMVKFLGQGGMGTVYEAHDQRLDRAVAIKIIRAEYFRDVSVRVRFRQEARSIAKISHPGVIALHDTGELGDGSAFLVMELLSGMDLADLLHDYGAATPRQVAILMRQAGDALTAAHGAELIHRDIKPENVFVVDGATGWQVKVLDFGLAKSMSIETTNLTQTGVVMGTPVYMSPEQIQGKSLDARSDLYSFACVCYEALTGRRVVESEEFARICAEVMHTSPPTLREYLPEIPLVVERAFMSALAKDRSERPADIASWVESVAPALERLPADGQLGWPRSLRKQDAPHSTAEGTTIDTDPLGLPEDSLERASTRAVKAALAESDDDLLNTQAFRPPVDV